jgi:hypothetical protein
VLENITEFAAYTKSRAKHTKEKVGKKENTDAI